VPIPVTSDVSLKQVRVEGEEWEWGGGGRVGVERWQTENETTMKEERLLKSESYSTMAA